MKLGIDCYKMKLAALFGSTLLVICMQMVSCSSMTPVYGAKAPASPADCPAHSYVASKRVGIYPETPSAHLYGSVESSEEHPTTVDHYMPMGPCKDGHCAGKRLPVSICVQLPGAAPKKLSKNLLQQIICSLMHDPAAPASPAHYTPYEPQHKKPCEYPKKPCECSKKPYAPPKEPCDKPKETYEPVHKVYEPTSKPCAHEPTKKPYTPPCKPTYAPEKESCAWVETRHKTSVDRYITSLRSSWRSVPFVWLYVYVSNTYVTVLGC